jgi:hypothetical protein
LREMVRPMLEMGDDWFIFSYCIFYNS